MPLDNPFHFSGQVVLITGPTGALGRPIATAFAQAGATLALADLDDAAGARLARELTRPDAAARAFHLDVEDPGSVQAMADAAVGAFGRIDVLVNVAGINARHDAADYPLQLWDKVMDIDLRGTWLACQAVGRVMLAQEGGCIVNVASGAAYSGSPGYAAYSPAKAGVASLTRVLGGEWAPRGIRVNAIAPGHTDSPMLRSMMTKPGMLEAAAQRMPVRQILPPEAQVGPVLFLASEAARWITGVTLRVDGGWHTT